MKELKKKVMGSLENFAKAMVQPLMFLAVAGIVMIVGVFLTNSTLASILPFLQWKPLQILGNLIYNCVMVLINNLSVVFAVGIAAAFAKKDKHQAAMIGMMSYLMYLMTSNTLLQSMGKMAEKSEMLGLIGTGQAEILGIQCVDMSVFGGIILGCITGYVFNKTCDKKFKGFMQMYSGIRFSFLMMFFVSILYGVAGNLVWPVVQQGISALAGLIKDSGTFGLFLYGFLERLLVPTGLHHLIYTPFQFSDLGGTIQAGGQTVAGAYAIVMTEMKLPVERFSDSIYFMATGFTKMFGYFGIGAAFIHTAYKKNKKRVKATVIPLVITAALASVTEPIDFMFAFCAPFLYFIHSVIAGLFIALLKIFDVTAFCGGNLPACLLMNIITGTEKTHWPVMVILGIAEMVVYYFVFTFLIKKFSYKTPGRETEENMLTDKEAAGTDALEKGDGKGTSQADTADDNEGIRSVIQGLGGKENITTVENCFTRLRVHIKELDLLDEALINKVPNSGIVKKGNDIQIIYGLQAPDMRRAVEEMLKERIK